MAGPAGGKDLGLPVAPVVSDHGVTQRGEHQQGLRSGHHAPSRNVTSRTECTRSAGWACSAAGTRAGTPFRGWSRPAWRVWSSLSSPTDPHDLLCGATQPRGGDRSDRAGLPLAMSDAGATVLDCCLRPRARAWN